MKSEMPAQPFLPHRSRMLLVDTVTAFDLDRLSGQVQATLRPGGPYFRSTDAGPQFAGQWLIELAAQASAVVSNVGRSQPGEAAPFGYLVSVRDFTVAPELALAPGDILIFDVVFEVAMQPVGQSRCTVSVGERVIAAGEMTFLSDE